MAGASHDQATSICSHCDRAIPSSNFGLHFAHCSRNLEKCKVCDDMVPRKFAEEHFLSTHAPMAWEAQPLHLFPVRGKSLRRHVWGCRPNKSETMDRGILDVHKGENCPKRIVTCEYCEFPLPAIDLLEHQEVCGNRTELCHMCHNYIRLRERHGHESRCSGLVNNIADSSRNVRPPDSAPRRQPQEFSPRRLLFTIAIAGIAVFLGSLFLQRKPDPGQAN